MLDVGLEKNIPHKDSSLKWPYRFQHSLGRDCLSIELDVDDLSGHVPPFILDQRKKDSEVGRYPVRGVSGGDIKVT
jgi:hypothetical protein